MCLFSGIYRSRVGLGPVKNSRNEERTIMCRQQLRLAFDLKKVAHILPEDGTYVPKHVGETHLVCVLIRNFVFVWHG